MSRLEKVQKHNKNVVDAVNVLSSKENISYTVYRNDRDIEIPRRVSFKFKYSPLLERVSYDFYEKERYDANLVDKDRLMKKFCYVKKISEIVHLKKNLVDFYNNLSVFYNNHVSYAKSGMSDLDKEKKSVAQIPEILKQTEQQLKELNEFVNTKDADYKACVELYKKYQKNEENLHATESYVVQETQTEHYTDYESRSEMVWDCCLNMSRIEYRSVPVHKTRYVTRDVTKYRPDTKKIAAAKIALAELKKEIAKFPTYDRNVEIYNSYDTIDELKNTIEYNTKHLEKANEIQSKIIKQVKFDLKTAKKLQEILEREKEVIESFIKNPKKYELRDVSELPEREL